MVRKDAASAPGPSCAGTAIENRAENISATAIGMPRRPQAIARKDTKVAGTISAPRANGWSCSNCTPRNSGSPSNGAGSICRNLPRRGPGRSGGAVTITPTDAAEAAAAPKSTCTRAEMSISPTATEMPLAT